MTQHSEWYDEQSFWRKVRRFALKAGRQVIEKALMLYYCLMDPDTPHRAKMIIIGALGYFILPFDLIPDLIPGIGFTDDLTALALALSTVMRHIKPEHRRRARELMEWEVGKQDSDSREYQQRRPPPPPPRMSEDERHRLTLGLERNQRLTAAELRARYRELAVKYHPDKVQHLGAEFQQMAEEKLKAINAAYAYLKRNVTDG